MERQDDSGRAPGRRRLPGVLLALLLIGVGIAGLAVAFGSRPGAPTVESSEDPGALADPDPSPAATDGPTETGTSSDGDDGDGAEAWADRDRDGTFAELIRLAEAAAATEPPADVALVASAHTATLEAGEDGGDARLMLARADHRWTPDGVHEASAIELGAASAGDRSAAALHDAYARAGELSRETETDGPGDPRDIPDGVAERAAAEAAAAGSTDAVVTAVHEALQLTWASDQLRRWQPALLAALRDLDPETVSVESPITALDGRTVVPLAVARADGSLVLLFDAETGAYAGSGIRDGDGWTSVTVVEPPAPEA